MKAPLLACLTLFGLIAISATASAQDSAKKPAIFPLVEGTEWVYTAGNAEIVERVAKFEKIGDEECARLETLVGGKTVSFEHLAVRKDGIYRVTVAGTPVEPALRFLALPHHPGTAWPIDSTIQSTQIKGRFVQDDAVVKLPKGEFQAISVKGEDFESEGMAFNFEYFFVPGVGKVRQVISANGKEMELILKEYRPAEKATK